MYPQNGRMARTWSKWEKWLYTFLNQSDILQKLQAHNQLNAHEDSKGRITYSKIADKKSFGIFSDIVTGIVPRPSIYKIPSIARLLKQDTLVYPWYYVQYSSLEEDDFEFTPSLTTGRPSLEDILENVGKEPMVGICILENKHMGMYHGVAFITWRVGETYKFAYYDPIAYQRKKQRKDGSIYFSNYDYAAMAFQSRRFDVDIDFINLSDHCLRKNEEEYHCPQYMMDAEYCYLNSLFFLYKWVQHGKPLDTEGLASVVHSCYVVDPNKLTRANTHESMTYRVIMMSFIASVLYRYLRSLSPSQASLLGLDEKKSFLNRVVCFNADWSRDFGFQLMQPSLVRNPRASQC
jgi:hypothetical protein